MSIEKRRIYERKPFVKNIKYYLTYPDMEESKKIEFDAVTVDISEGGLGMITDYPLMTGDTLSFKDEIKVDNFVAKSSTVRWSTVLAADRCRAGVEFVR